MHYCTILSNTDGTRKYRNPTQQDFHSYSNAEIKAADLSISPSCVGIPNEKLSTTEPRRLNIIQYGFDTWGSLFTCRQRLYLLTMTEIVSDVLKNIRKEYRDERFVEALQTVLAVSVSNTIQYNCNMSTWLSDGMISIFIQSSSIPMRADYAEANPTMRKLVGGLRYQFDSTIDVLNEISGAIEKTGSTALRSATEQILPEESVDLLATDPPYYFAIPYAELSDFFYVWLKRLLRDVHDLLLSNEVTPKAQEAIQNLPHSKAVGQKDRAHFEQKIYEGLVVGRSEIRRSGLALIIFAHAETEGWESLIRSLLGAGWIVTASWPIDTERKGRMLTSRQRSLASSIHLVCRPRADDAEVGDWADILRELPPRVFDWMERLQGEGIRGADLVFACIGPALEIFSRYRSVETADGRQIALPEYLEKVWEVVGRAALAQVLGTSEAGSLEEDARLTALFLWTLQSTETSGESGNGKKEEEQKKAIAKVATKGFNLPFDVVRRFAQPMGIDLDVWTGRIIAQKKGVVRLLPVAERARELFGEDGAGAAADWIETDPNANLQAKLFPELDAAPTIRSHRRSRKSILDSDAELQTIDATTLDRVHAAMLLQASGHANALRKLIGAEQDRGPDFLRLANAVSALYPRGSQEKRLLDAMLLAVPR